MSNVGQQGAKFDTRTRACVYTPWIIVMKFELFMNFDLMKNNGQKAQQNKLCGRPPQYARAPRKLTFDILTLKVMSESV